ncbi:MAG: hypothetical protein JWN66_4937 [Sphingomonas bacterium]|uniref:hypothetical protein n=1 Tax=Sphingomonas bacterium TaxID=1895847 RepID=UPI00261CA4C1|nr:hypothetical protein [Sphingomonas bacterium]MDB5707821.1 hypothetical protein [Sphingomonas bacterium]
MTRTSQNARLLVATEPRLFAGERDAAAIAAKLVLPLTLAHDRFAIDLAAWKADVDAACERGL